MTNRLKDEIRRLDVDLHKQKIVAEKFQDENESLKNQTSKFEDSIKDLTDKNQRLMTQVEALRVKESQLRQVSNAFKKQSHNNFSKGENTIPRRKNRRCNTSKYPHSQ